MIKKVFRDDQWKTPSALQVLSAFSHRRGLIVSEPVICTVYFCLFQQSVPPVMAFHLGSLGFLTPFEFDNFEEQVTNVLEGKLAPPTPTALLHTYFHSRQK